jgi:transposase-like protein
MGRLRRNFSAQQKAAIVREHLIDRVAVSDLCDKHGIQPTVFYRWQKTMFENLALLFERQGDSKAAALQRHNEALQAKLARKDEVIAEIMIDLIEVKKKSGGV